MSSSLRHKARHRPLPAVVVGVLLGADWGIALVVAIESGGAGLSHQTEIAISATFALIWGAVGGSWFARLATTDSVYRGLAVSRSN